MAEQNPEPNAPESGAAESCDLPSVNSQLSGVLYALSTHMKRHPGAINREQIDCLIAIAERVQGASEVSVLRAQLEALKPLIHATALKSGIVTLEGTAWETPQ